MMGLVRMSNNCSKYEALQKIDLRKSATTNRQEQQIPGFPQAMFKHTEKNIYGWHLKMLL